MNRNRSSETAEQMALSRAIETFKRENGICDDPYARLFLSPPYSIPLVTRFSRNLTEKIVERLFPGHHYYVAARTRYLDDKVIAFETNHGGQVVILGAGYDSRAYRLESLKRSRVIEVDHPATQKRKKEILIRHFGKLPEHVVYVSVDFNRENLPDKLISSGYDDGKTTLFIWEGTTPYLLSEAVDSTLKFVAANRGEKSSIVFDYILYSVLNDSCIFEDAHNERDKMARTSEPFVFGIEKEYLAEYLTERDLVLIEDVGDEYFIKAYMEGYSSDKKIKPWWRIAHAVTRSGQPG